MKFERHAKSFSWCWRWTWGHFCVTRFRTTSPFRFYHGGLKSHWWSLWFSQFNLDWDSTDHWDDKEFYGA